MAKLDPYETEIIRDCHRGVVSGGFKSGSFCRKRDLCFAERRCYFVAQAQHHMERAWAAPIPGRIVWSRGFDYEPETLSMFEAA